MGGRVMAFLLGSIVGLAAATALILGISWLIDRWTP